MAAEQAEQTVFKFTQVSDIISGMDNRKRIFEELFSRYGTVTRARGCFLYTKKGVRITDLYQENGRAVLGWGGGAAFTRLKNTLNRGATGSYITEEKPGIEKAVGLLLNSERTVRFFATKNDAVKASLRFSPEGTSVWMPWSPAGTAWETVESAVIAPPLPWTDSLYMIAVRKDIAEKKYSGTEIPAEIKIPFPIEAAAARAVYDMIAALQTRSENDWFIYDTVLTKYWTRKGPYLFPKAAEEDYTDFAIHCLDCGILVNPEFGSPSIVPFGADRGVFTKLRNSPFRGKKTQEKTECTES